MAGKTAGKTAGSAASPAHPQHRLQRRVLATRKHGTAPAATDAWQHSFSVVEASSHGDACTGSPSCAAVHAENARLRRQLAGCREALHASGHPDPQLVERAAAAELDLVAVRRAAAELRAELSEAQGARPAGATDPNMPSSAVANPREPGPAPAYAAEQPLLRRRKRAGSPDADTAAAKQPRGCVAWLKSVQQCCRPERAKHTDRPCPPLSAFVLIMLLVFIIYTVMQHRLTTRHSSFNSDALADWKASLKQVHKATTGAGGSTARRGGW